MRRQHSSLPWFRPRGYAHIDLRVGERRARKIVTEFQRAPRKHGFLPLIAYSIEQVRYKRNCEGRFIKHIKSRKIAYASHADSTLYSYYAFQISSAYEEVIKRESLSDSVLAYRTYQEKKCNLHFAFEAFAEILQRGNVKAAAYDIKGFFDNLDHNILLNKWKEVLNAQTLPEDHYCIYRAITRCSRLNRKKLLIRMGISDSQFRKLKCLRITNEKIYSMQDIREILRDKLLYNPSELKGVPQGTPISALLSNVYMLDVDRALASACKNVGASYRRYSDDILILAEEHHFETIKNELSACLKSVGLVLADGKEQVVMFRKGDDGVITSDTGPLQYLGLIFDGRRALIRRSSISRYYSNMKKAVSAAGHAAAAALRHRKPSQIREKKLHNRFTHLGRQTFIRYAREAVRISRVYGVDFKYQLKRHFTVLKNRISVRQQLVYRNRIR
jgi:RNA-directed DNA polymerase